MKTLKQTISESFVNEAKQTNEEAKYLGYTLGNATSKDDFGDVIKSLKDLKKGDVYAMKDPGLVQWMVDLKYIGKKGSEHVFQDLLSSPIHPEEFTYSQKEMDAMLNDGDIHEYLG